QPPVEMQVLPDGGSPPQAQSKAADRWRIVHSLTDLGPTRVTAAEFVGGGVLAAGVVAALDRRRRARRRRRRPGAPFVVPGERLADVELGLRVAADIDGAEFVRVALGLVEATGYAPEILGVRMSARQVAIRFVDPPPRAPAPFKAVGGGWVLPRRALTDIAA